MISVAKSTGATLANGALTLWVQDSDGFNVDLYSGAIQILDADGGTVLVKTALNVAGAEHLGLGHYAFAWDPGSAAVGQYTVRWFYQILAADMISPVADEASFDQEMEIVAKPYTGPNYCTVYDLQAEGLASDITAARAQSLIVRASRYVENFTGRRFGIVRKVVTIDGSQARALMIEEPIVMIEKILLTVVSAFGSSDLTVRSDTLKVFNRHIREGLLQPDDRDNPKLEFVHGDDLNGVNYDYRTQTGYVLSSLMWPRGRHNVQVTGLYGYTEPDGSFTGKVPELVREAVKLLAIKQSTLAAERLATPDPSRINREQTKDQAVGFQDQWLKGGFTGDWQVDQLLLMFVRPPHFGAA